MEPMCTDTIYMGFSKTRLSNRFKGPVYRNRLVKVVGTRQVLSEMWACLNFHRSGFLTSAFNVYPSKSFFDFSMN